ncbi:MAG: hypothetical protein IPM32_15345 [Ignavibacteriae bacterium]|nr:hypothetical protein [Ignavibacteriota bacterium]
MYTPALSEELIRKLYQLKQVEKRPMTVLINEAVEMYLNNKVNNNNIQGGSSGNRN